MPRGRPVPQEAVPASTNARPGDPPPRPQTPRLTETYRTPARTPAGGIDLGRYTYPGSSAATSSRRSERGDPKGRAVPPSLHHRATRALGRRDHRCFQPNSCGREGQSRLFRGSRSAHLHRPTMPDGLSPPEDRMLQRAGHRAADFPDVSKHRAIFSARLRPWSVSPADVAHLSSIGRARGAREGWKCSRPVHTSPGPLPRAPPDYLAAEPEKRGVGETLDPPCWCSPRRHRQDARAHHALRTVMTGRPGPARCWRPLHQPGGARDARGVSAILAAGGGPGLAPSPLCARILAGTRIGGAHLLLTILDTDDQIRLLSR